MVVVTYRDGEVGPALQRVLGALGGAAVHRLAPARLSRAAVARLTGGTTATSAPLYRLTAGNPFFVSEMLAVARSGDRSRNGDGPVTVPSTVVDAVLARVQRLGPAEQAALEQLSVVPSGMELPLARTVLGDLGVLAGAERTGLVEVRANAVAFRHELSRRAVEAALPVAVRMRCNARVLAALVDEPDPDLVRVVHHAGAAGDEAAVVAHAPAAARAANRLGAHAQEVALQEQALHHRSLLDPAEEAARRAGAGDGVVHPRSRARGAGRRPTGGRAVTSELDAPGPLAEVLVTLALGHWALVQMPECLATAERAVAVAVLRPGGTAPQHAYALAYLGGLQVERRPGRGGRGGGDGGRGTARQLGAPALVALGRIACGNPRMNSATPAVSTSCAPASRRRPRCRPTFW